jgi:uncharacterized membrane protein (DUF485 family)
MISIEEHCILRKYVEINHGERKILDNFKLSLYFLIHYFKFIILIHYFEKK